MPISSCVLSIPRSHFIGPKRKIVARRSALTAGTSPVPEMVSCFMINMFTQLAFDLHDFQIAELSVQFGCSYPPLVVSVRISTVRS